MSNAPKTVSAYLVHSYLYYVLNYSVIPDSSYDAIHAYLREHPEEVHSHPHGHLVDLTARTSSAFHIKEEDYPRVVAYTAKELYNKHRRTN